jgi:hypothetical protein
MKFTECSVVDAGIVPESGAADAGDSGESSPLSRARLAIRVACDLRIIFVPIRRYINWKSIASS